MVFINNQDIREKIEEAKNCKELKIQKELAEFHNINVRRSLAKNPYLDSAIADKLAFDPSLNVSYIASKNRNTRRKREFSSEDLQNKCVVCEKDELSLDCNTCTL